jgi:hypothetical protein
MTRSQIAREDQHDGEGGGRGYLQVYIALMHANVTKRASILCVCFMRYILSVP